MQENQPAAQIAARHSIFSQMAPYNWKASCGTDVLYVIHKYVYKKIKNKKIKNNYVMNLLGAGGNRSRVLSPGRRDS